MSTLIFRNKANFENISIPVKNIQIIEPDLENSWATVITLKNKKITVAAPFKDVMREYNRATGVIEPVTQVVYLVYYTGLDSFFCSFSTFTRAKERVLTIINKNWIEQERTCDYLWQWSTIDEDEYVAIIESILDNEEGRG